MKTKNILFSLLVIVLAIALTGMPAMAEYPDKPITLIIPLSLLFAFILVDMGRISANLISLGAKRSATRNSSLISEVFIRAKLCGSRE